MKVLILCDRDSTGAGFELCGQVEKTVKQAGCEVRTVVLNSDEIPDALQGLRQILSEEVRA